MNSQQEQTIETHADATCRDCGCTDSHACPGGCSWSEINRVEKTGVCSRCADVRKVVDGETVLMNTSHITALKWGRDSLKMVVLFRGGSAYEYRNVPERIPTGMVRAESIGSFFDAEVKKHPELYPYRKLSPEEARPTTTITHDKDQAIHITPKDTSLPEARCACGCTDSKPCTPGCGWWEIDRSRGIGVCSNCRPGQPAH